MGESIVEAEDRLLAIYYPLVPGGLRLHLVTTRRNIRDIPSLLHHRQHVAEQVGTHVAGTDFDDPRI